MVSKCGVVVQSYEEVPYLLWLLKHSKGTVFSSKKLSVLSFGGDDFWLHLNHLLKDSGVHLINLNFENSGNKKNLKNIIYLIKYYFYLKFTLPKRLNSIAEVVFFTPFCAPHLISILRHYKPNEKFFITIPALISKGYLDKSGKIISKGSCITPNIFSFVRLIKLRTFFGKNIDLVQLGSALEPVLSSAELENCQLVNHMFNMKDNPTYDRFYLDQNYISNFDLEIKQNISVVFFDQHYIRRKIVRNTEYRELLSEVFQIFNNAGYKCYYKGHPDLPPEKPDELPKFISSIPSFLPAEYLSLKGVIFLSVTSGAISNNIGDGISVSLIDLIPFLDPLFKGNAEKVLQNKTKTRIYCPKDLNEVERLIIDVGMAAQNSNEFSNCRTIFPFS